MSNIQASGDVGSVPADKFQRYVALYLIDCSDKVNGKLELGVNVVGKILSVKFLTQSVDLTIAHGLGFVPNGYIQVGADVPMDIFDGTLAATATAITLQSTRAGTARIYFF